MRILLDENVPKPLVEPLSWLLPGHVIEQVNRRFKGIKDEQLYDKAKRKKFEMIISADGNQLYDEGICKAIQRSGLHAVFVETGNSSLGSLAAAAGALIHSIRDIIGKLEKAESQHVAIVQMLHGDPGYSFHDPRRDAPSPMWPRKQHGEHKPSRKLKK
ncbi:hypothetical protein [Streptosporangium sp. 'caverna']|uniref:hypothetical protein n=1 Tax=Streptosporangium sp. 'caverna' TaxID=2202249 RepID=UPI000D7D7598|nr:hypothetical protein [Streptosporangium sp. 'caverna']AWS47892.1 hypothetical protein DKM19_48070 [Streptosporangium sp. 'caverna']